MQLSGAALPPIGTNGSQVKPAVSVQIVVNPSAGMDERALADLVDERVGDTLEHVLNSALFS